MKRLGLAVAVVALALAGALAAEEGKPAMPMEHTVIAAGAIVWGPSPPGLPAGAKAAVLSGNPGAKGPYTIRAILPNGYKIAPHWHPAAENLTVLSGTLHVGMGDVVDAAKATPLGAGGFAVMPAEMRHWVWAEGEVTLQVHGEGPFMITYVNPKDDPRTASTH